MVQGIVRWHSEAENGLSREILLPSQERYPCSEWAFVTDLALRLSRLHVRLP